MFKKLMNIIENKEKCKEKNIDNLDTMPQFYIKDDTIRHLLNDDLKLTEIPDVFKLLLHRDEKVRLKAAEVLNYAMSDLSSTSLIKLDKIFRERTSYEWAYDWSNENPIKLIHPSMSEEEKISILGLSSFHPNGYFREKAIIALSDMNTGRAISYILIRINDWVMAVRTTSKKQLQRYINVRYARDFVRNLPLVLRLKECLRGEHIDVVNSVVSIISSSECCNELISGLETDESKLRLACYKIILQTKVMDNRTIINHIIKDTDPFNRFFVLRNIKDEITREEFLDIWQLLFQDKLSQIRIIALELMDSFMAEEAIGILKKSLFDNNQSVREMCRYLLSKYKKYDFAAIYGAAIQKGESLYSSICGLGETGRIDDSKVISKFIDSDVNSLVKAAIYALSKLDMQGYKERIILLLNDDRAGVSRAARRVLSKEINAADAEDIYRIFKNASHDHVRFNCSVLLCSLGISKWMSIRYIIEFCADKNRKNSLLAQRSLERWHLSYNKSFSRPSANQIKNIREALATFGNFIKASDREFIGFCIKDFS